MNFVHISLLLLAAACFCVTAQNATSKTDDSNLKIIFPSTTAKNDGTTEKSTTTTTNLTTITPAPTKPTTTESKPTEISTTAKPNVTTTLTPKPNVTTTLTPKPTEMTTTSTAKTTISSTPSVPATTPSGHVAPISHERHFDGPSFIGGIVLTVGLSAIGFVAFKFFRPGKVEGDYRNLVESPRASISSIS